MLIIYLVHYYLQLLHCSLKNFNFISLKSVHKCFLAFSLIPSPSPTMGLNPFCASVCASSSHLTNNPFPYLPSTPFTPHSPHIPCPLIELNLFLFFASNFPKQNLLMASIIITLNSQRFIMVFPQRNMLVSYPNCPQVLSGTRPIRNYNNPRGK